MKIQLRNEHDIAALLAWREEVISTVFEQRPSRELMDANRRYYEEHMPDGSHFTIVATADGDECGCGAVCFTDEMPSPDNPSGRCAYLMNIYVRDAYRSHGVAHHIVGRLIAEALDRGCGKIYLETTDDGRPVYESLGFCDMQGMMKYRPSEL